MDTPSRDAASKLRLGSMLLACVAAVGMLQQHARAQVSAAAPTAPAASSASAPVVVTPAPATRAAEGSRTPGELRPEQPVVPQVAVPLKRDGTLPADAPVTGAAPVRDSAARCLAIRSKAERAACERGLAASAPAARRP